MNIFFTTSAGMKTGGRSTTHFSAELGGIAYNPRNGHLFVSDDQADETYEVDPVQDHRCRTEDDVITSFSTRKACNKEPEGVAFDIDGSRLLVVDGVSTDVYRYRPGDNGRFDGIPPDGDEKVRHFVVGHYGEPGPEGIACDSDRNSMLVLDHKSQKIYELTEPRPTPPKTDREYR